MYQFAENLKILRTKKGLTQTQLANKLWVNKSIISAYENQQRMPSLEVLVKLSYEFGVSMEYLLGIEKCQTIDVTGLNENEISAVTNLVNILKNKKAQ